MLGTLCKCGQKIVRTDKFGGFSLSDSAIKHKEDKKAADFEVYGGIKLGSTEEELKKAFGEPESALEGEPSTHYYRYTSDEIYRSYTFALQDGKVTNIEWKNLVFNQKK